MLTTGADKGAAFTGTDNADTFKADILTLTAGDELDGGAGADVLNVETNASVANTVKIANIETINMNALGAVSVDFANITGVQEFNSNNSVGAVSLNNVANAGLALGLKGSATNNINATFTAAAVAGTADVLNVNLNGATAAAVTVNSGFESVKVNTTAESTLATLTATGATSVTLNNSAKLTVNDGTLDAFQTYTVEGAGELNLGDVATVRTFDASKATGAVKMGADTAAGFAQGTATKTLTMDTTGGLVQTGAGNDVVAVNAGNVFTTNSTSVKLGAGNDSLRLTGVGNGGLYVFGEAGDDTIYAAASLKAGNLIDGGEGTDTLNFATATNSSLIARSIEKVGLEGTGVNTVNFVSTDVATAIADGGSAATTVTGLLNGSTFSASVAKNGLTTLGFKAGEKATVNANFTKGTTGGLTVTNAETVTATYGAASNLTGAITLDAAGKSLTINATGALAGAQDIAASGTENLTTLVATGDKGITLGAITNDAKLTSVSVKSTGGDAIVGAVGAAGNIAADFQVTSIEVSTTEGKATLGNIDFSGVATTATGLISSIVVSGVDGANASSVGSIDADKLGTVSVTSTKQSATIGAVTVGADTADTTDGTVTSLSAVGLLASSIGAVKADKVDSITVQSTSATTGNASLASVADGSGTGKATVGNITVTSAGAAASVEGSVGAGALGNVTVTGKTTAALGDVTVTKAGNDSVTGNINVTAGTVATLGDISLEKAGSFNVKATAGNIKLGSVLFADTAAKAVALDAGDAIVLGGGGTAADEAIKNTNGDLTVTVKAGGALATANVLTVEAGSAGHTSDIDITFDASQVVGAVGATTELVVVDNKGVDASSSTIVVGGKAANFFDIKAAGGTVSYQGQNGADTVTLSGNYKSSTISTEGGIDVITLGGGLDTINENGSAVSLKTGSYTGFDIIKSFTAGTDVLNVAGSVKGLAVEFNSTTSVATVDTTTPANNVDTLLYVDANGNGSFDSGELGIMLVGVALANVDINGALAGTGLA